MPFKIRYIREIEKIHYLSEAERGVLKEVEKRYPFRANEYYINLINWNDPDDPLRKIIIPQVEELEEWGLLDPSNEARYTIIPGLQHKYRDTALILVTDYCGSYCRFCFRKRLFMHIKDEIPKDITPDLDYISKHKEITNVLLTGGDPLFISSKNIENIIRTLRGMKHIKIIRIGTKMPAFNPYKIIKNKRLIKIIHKYSKPDRRIYIVVQFNHPREINIVSIEAVKLLISAGAILVNQTPILKGINDSEETLRELFCRLSCIGVSPYYVFQCRPTVGNKPFILPIVKTYEIFEKAKRGISGIDKRARLAISHQSGKIEILAITRDKIILMYHRSAIPKNEGKIVIYKKNPNAYWLDELGEPLETISQ
ncbi:MAG: KamA family radical SAM protein [bacterium]